MPQSADQDEDSSVRVSTVWGWYLTLESPGQPTKFFAPNLHKWLRSFAACQPSHKVTVESFAVLFAAKKPLWIGKLVARRMKPANVWNGQTFYSGPLTKEPLTHES